MPLRDKIIDAVGPIIILLIGVCIGVVVSALAHEKVYAVYCPPAPEVGALTPSDIRGYTDGRI